LTVSVLLPVRDGERYLREALDSLLGESATDLEVVVVDDGSTDATPEILGSYADERLRVVAQGPEGLVAALNRGLEETRGATIVRMDADDVSLPSRLERQQAVLGADERIGLVGCGIETIDGEGRATGSWLLPEDDAGLRRRLLLRNPFAHGSVAIRRAALEAAGGYSGDYGANEDYDLWRRIAREWCLAAVPEVLYRYREHPDAVTKSDVGERLGERERLRDELWGEPALMRALRGERDRVERRALVHEALRRRRYRAAARCLGDVLRATTSS
jgi:glycosyltransferase involved in cell wall biosynthesis